MRLKTLATTVTVVAAVLAAASTPLTGESRQTVLAPGYSGLSYELPHPGDYALPPLGNAGDGSVLNTEGDTLPLHGFLGDRIVLLSFMYTRCSDTSGCPLATTVFYKVKKALNAEPLLIDRLRLISLSFDPAYDTPDVMGRYGAGFRDGSLEWQFLTTHSESELDPILEAYNQAIQREYDDGGEPLGTISHILRVFLIDRGKRIRNIYSVAFLHEDVLINDIKTLILEDEPLTGSTGVLPGRTPGSTLSQSNAQEPGDARAGYDSPDYVSQSVSLDHRTGEPADLLRLLESPPLGLPAVPASEDNVATREKIELGRKLFYDRRLSLNNTFSCAMCHIPEQGFTNNEMATAVGIEGRSVRRNAPTIYNTAFLTRLFHDGREYNLEQQIWSPLLDNNEMGNPSVGSVIARIQHLPDYRGRFEKAFAGKGPGMETIGMAIASYERTLVSANSPFDRWYFGKQENALRKEARRGFELFNGKAGCVACHTIGKDHALFTDNELHNTGIGYTESMGRRSRMHEVAVAPGVRITVPGEIIRAVSGPRQTDLGLYEVTQHPDDRWKYRTPSLRNVALTAPYMHNGSLGTLGDVVEFYRRGGVPNELLDPRIRPLDLTDQDVNDLVIFLESLTGDNIDMLVSDAFAAPIGN